MQLPLWKRIKDQRFSNKAQLLNKINTTTKKCNIYPRVQDAVRIRSTTKKLQQWMTFSFSFTHKMNSCFSNQDNNSPIVSYPAEQSLRRIIQHTTSAAYADYYHFTTLETNDDFSRNTCGCAIPDTNMNFCLPFLCWKEFYYEHVSADICYHHKSTPVWYQVIYSLPLSHRLELEAKSTILPT